MNIRAQKISLEEQIARAQHKVILCEMRIADLEDRDFFLTNELEKKQRQLIQTAAFQKMSRKQKIGFLRHILEKLENGDAFWWERATDWN